MDTPPGPVVAEDNVAAPLRRVIHGGSVALDDGSLAPLDVEIRGDRVHQLGPHGSLARDADGADTVDARGKVVSPGFVDLQINGGWGHDFTTDPESISAVAAELPATGVTAFVPTIVSAPSSRRLAAISAWRAADAEHSRERPKHSADALGLHFEGPLISPSCAGAHDRTAIVSDAEDVDDWGPNNGVVVVTLAPEGPKAVDTVAALAARGVVVSIGHTACSVDEFSDARRAGASLVTHLFNAMVPFDHRSPGPVGAALTDRDVVVGMICDGLHVDPVAVDLAWRLLGPERVLLVSDAVAALRAPPPPVNCGSGAGSDAMAPHVHRLGALDVTAGERGVRTSTGALAGSTLTLDEAIRNLTEFTGCGPGAAIRAATATPADVLGLGDRGRIRPGARADLVLLDDQLVVEETIIAGVTVWRDEAETKGARWKS